MIYDFSQNKHLDTFFFFDQAHVIVFVGKILEHFLAVNNVFVDLGGSIHKQHERQQQHSTSQHSTAVQHSSHRHHPNAQPNYSRLLGVG